MEVDIFLEKNQRYVRNGKEKINIVGRTSLKQLERQKLSRRRRGKKVTVIPVNAFLGERKRGKGVVTSGLEKQVIENALDKSYRKSVKATGDKFCTETIRQKVITKGKEAMKTEKTKAENNESENEIEENKIKDAGSGSDTYSKSGKSKGSLLRNLFAGIFETKALYFMADGVGVERQYKDNEKKKGKRECKVGVFLSQSGETIKELGTFCTWKRIDEFKKMTEWLLLKVFMPFTPIVIISDGAKWIRNLRNKIPRLKKAIWILDWFHLKDTTLKMFRAFELTEESETVQTVIGWLWHGNTEKALEIINRLPVSEDEQEKEKQIAAFKKFKIYLENQKEGIVNYQSYKMRGYLVGSGYMEKRNDTLIKERMVRQGRMRWGLDGGEAMMQLLTAKMNGRISELFV